MIFVCSLFSQKILFFFFCIVQGVIFYFCQNNCDCASDCSCSCSICTRYKDESQNQFQHLDRVLDGKWISYIPLFFPPHEQSLRSWFVFASVYVLLFFCSTDTKCRFWKTVLENERILVCSFFFKVCFGKQNSVFKFKLSFVLG